MMRDRMPICRCGGPFRQRLLPERCQTRVAVERGDTLRYSPTTESGDGRLKTMRNRGWTNSSWWAVCAGLQTDQTLNRLRASSLERMRPGQNREFVVVNAEARTGSGADQLRDPACAVCELSAIDDASPEHRLIAAALRHGIASGGFEMLVKATEFRAGTSIAGRARFQLR